MVVPSDTSQQLTYPCPSISVLSTPDAPKTACRSNYGLKSLSTKVKDVVLTRSRTTYSEVADILISEMGVTANTKDEKNIRRRVYDALNVLKSAKVIKKTGKTVSWSSYFPLPAKITYAVDK
jgi:hypothetical protein